MTTKFYTRNLTAMENLWSERIRSTRHLRICLHSDGCCS
jgi:hypothetical protein